MKVRCHMCEFWHRTVQDVPGKGECRIKAPVLFASQRESFGQVKPIAVTRWPSTEQDDFCGEGVAKGAKMDANS